MREYKLARSQLPWLHRVSLTATLNISGQRLDACSGIFLCSSGTRQAQRLSYEVRWLLQCAVSSLASLTCLWCAG